MRLTALLETASRHRRLVVAAALVTAAVSFGVLASRTGASAAVLTAALLIAVLGATLLTARRMRLRRMRREAHLRSRRPSDHEGDDALTRWSRIAMDERTRELFDSALRNRGPSQDLVIGHFDEDGRLHGPFGDLPGIGLEAVSRDAFRPRKRTSVELVLEGDILLVRKDFRDDYRAFVQEWYCLARLHGKVNVPTIYRVDEARRRIYKSLIPGRKVRDLMIDAGARILDEDLAHDPELEGLDPTARAEIVSRRGRRFVRACLPPGVVAEIARQLEVVHAHGITHFGFTPGNVIVDAEARPWFFDFDGARVHRFASGPFFAYRRRQDRLRFDRHFGEPVPEAPPPTSTSTVRRIPSDHRS